VSSVKVFISCKVYAVSGRKPDPFGQPHLDEKRRSVIYVVRFDLGKPAQLGRPKQLRKETSPRGRGNRTIKLSLRL
jgi:hypothetical protein